MTRRGTTRGATTRTGRRVAGLLATLLATLAVLCGVAPPAQAHTELVAATPQPGSVVSGRTTAVELGFSERLLPDLAAVRVEGEDGVDHVVGDPVVDGGTLVVRLRPLSRTGTYTVDYRVVAADGHEVEGSYDFRFQAPAPAAAPASTDDPAPVPAAAGAGDRELSLPPAPGPGTGPGDGPPPSTMDGLPIPPWPLSILGLLLVFCLLLRAAAGPAPAKAAPAEAAPAEVAR